MKKVVDAKGLAEHFGKSLSLIYGWRRMQGFPSSKSPGMPIMFHLDDVEKWLKENDMEPVDCSDTVKVPTDEDGLPTIEHLKKVLILKYDGTLIWRKRDISMFKNSGTYNRWNKTFAGKEAGTLLAPRQSSHLKYRNLRFGGKHLKSHRVVWALHYGRWPDKNLAIDHIDGDGLNNRPSNLREVSAQVNIRNSRQAKNNKSGITGVHWSKTSNKWRAEIRHNDKTIHLGLFEILRDAAVARANAEKLYGYHQNHGRRG